MTSAAQLRGQRLPRSERRAQLLLAAQEVFVARGYHAAAMDEIADRAGVSKPVLYQHFPGKLELYLALLDREADTLEALVRDAIARPYDKPRERVEATIAAYYDFVAREGAAFRLVFESDLTSEPRVRARIDSLEAACAEAIADVVAEHTGLDDTRSLFIATSIAGLAQISAQHWIGQAPGMPQDEAVAVTVALAWRGLGAVPASPGDAPATRPGQAG